MLNGNADAAKIIAAARAQVPQPFTGNASFTAAPDAVTLTLTRDQPWGAVERRTLLPGGGWGDGQCPLSAAVKHVGNELTLTLPRGSAEAAPAQWQWRAAPVSEGWQRRRVWDVTAQNSGPLGETSHCGSAIPSPAAPIAPPPSAPRPTGCSPRRCSWRFWAGLILNIMPCVLPILALKALALSEKSAGRRAQPLRLSRAFSYTAGVGGELSCSSPGRCLALQGLGLVPSAGASSCRTPGLSPSSPG
jgi:hypothetical protein